MPQTLLGPSAQNALIVLLPALPKDPYATTSLVAQDAGTVNSAFSRFPDEPLLPILENVVLLPPSTRPSCPCKTKHDTEVIRVLARVCRRFHRILQPLAYHTFRMEIPWRVTPKKSTFRGVQLPPKGTAERFYRKFLADRSIRRHCRALFISIDCGRARKLLSDMIKVVWVCHWMTNVRCLTISSARSQMDAGLGRIFVAMLKDCMKRIKHVDWIGLWKGGGRNLKSVVTGLQFPMLRKLRLDGWREERGLHNRLVLEPKVGLQGKILR